MTQRTHTQYLLQTLIRLQDRASRQGGYTLVVTIAMLLILSALLVTYAVMSKVDNASSMSTAKSSTGFYVAEAGLNIRASEIRRKLEGFNLLDKDSTSPSRWEDCLDSISGNDGSGDYVCQTESDAFKSTNTKDAFANQIGGQSVTTFITADASNPVSIVVPLNETFGGLSAQESRYTITSVARDNQNKPTSILKMQLKSRLVPLFQFAAFFQQDMDITLPPVMTLNGRVHSNNNLYFDAAPGGTLTIEGQVTTAGSLYRGLKYRTDQCLGTVTIDVYSSPRPLNCDGTSRNPFTAAKLLSWKNQVRVGLKPLTIPAPDKFNASPDHLYWDSADLRIALDVSDGSVSIFNQDGTPNLGLTSQLDTTCLMGQTTVTAAAAMNTTTLTVADAMGFQPNDLVTLGSGDRRPYMISTVSGSTITLSPGLRADVAADTTVQKPVISFSDKTFKNYREKRSGGGRADNTPIEMLNVNMRGLMNCAGDLMGGRQLDDTTNGGLVWYLTVQGADADTVNDYGVRIYDGRDLTTPIGDKTIQGLSVISDQAVYIRGDFNCGSTCSGSFNDDQRKPAAVMADSINILSNAWPLDDSWSERDIQSTFAGVVGAGRPAVDTTVNAAFLGGISITGGVNREEGQNKGDSSSGGGLNNYPRFHEDWSNRAGGGDATFTYQGSMVSLGPALKVNGPFCGSGYTADCNIYNPPTRNWRYDPKFNDVANLPPLTPRAVYLRQEDFTREFDEVALEQTPLDSPFESVKISALPGSRFIF